MPTPASRNPLAIVALVVGILSLCGGVLAPLGLGLGYLALRKARLDGGVGAAQARAALVASAVGLAVTGPLLIVVLRYSSQFGIP